MQEIVIISGKGGTGKTSLTSALAAIVNHAVLADCDVDAADLHLILSPTINERHDFMCGKQACIRPDACTACGRCQDLCQFDAINQTERSFSVDPMMCEGCGVCVKMCPANAIDFYIQKSGEWYRSSTRFGPLLHARLDIGAENSGKLVSRVRKEAQNEAAKIHANYVIIDGPPGIGCPVIASITGTDAVVIVTEPTLSGIHDLERVIDLAHHFNIPAYICVNKWDINPENTKKIEQIAQNTSSQFIGKIPYSSELTKAQIAAQSIMENGSKNIQNEFAAIWKNLEIHLTETKNEKKYH